MLDGLLKDNEILTIGEAALFLRLGRSTLYRLIERGDVPALRLGRSIRLRKSTLMVYLDGMDGGCGNGD